MQRYLIVCYQAMNIDVIDTHIFVSELSQMKAHPEKFYV